MVIDVLRNIHIDTVTRMNQYHKGIQNIIRPIEKQKQVSKYRYIIIIFLILIKFYIFLGAFVSILGRIFT